MLFPPRPLSLPHLGVEAGGPLAAGANLTWMPAARTHILIVTIQFQIICDANVANRFFTMEWGGAADTQFMHILPVALTAGNTYNIYAGIGFNLQLAGFFNFNYTMPLPSDLIFANPERFRTNILNIQAGDVINSYHLRYRQWLDPVIV